MYLLTERLIEEYSKSQKTKYLIRAGMLDTPKKILSGNEMRSRYFVSLS